MHNIEIGKKHSKYYKDILANMDSNDAIGMLEKMPLLTGGILLNKAEDVKVDNFFEYN